MPLYQTPLIINIQITFSVARGNNLQNPAEKGFHVNNSDKEKYLQSKEDLREIQQFLLDLAERVVVEEKKFNLYPLDLLEIAKESAKYPENVLFQNITELYQEKWIVPGEPMTKNLVFDILDHRRIYTFILEHPGCDTLDVMNGVGISFRYALKNLETLFKFGFIRAHKYSQYFLYFPSFMPEEQDLIYCLTRNITIRQILRYLSERKAGITVSKMSQVLEKQEVLILRKLTQLTHAHIVRLIQNGMILKYKIADLDEGVLQDILNRYDK